MIRCGDEPIYWMVDHTPNGYTVRGTDKSAEASLFSIFPTDDGDHPFEFYIGWNGAQGDEEIEPAFRYLDAPLDIKGCNSGPLSLKSQTKKQYSRFSIRGRLSGMINSNVDLQEWVKGKDSFFIKCSRRYFRTNGFVAMRMQHSHILSNVLKQTQDPTEYRTCCVSSKKKHNERDTWMVFRLLSHGEHSQGLSKPGPKLARTRKNFTRI